MVTWYIAVFDTDTSFGEGSPNSQLNVWPSQCSNDTYFLQPPAAVNWGEPNVHMGMAPSE